MTPAQAIAILDRQLATKGTAVVWRRYAGLGPARSPADVALRASVRGYQPQEIVGGVAAGDARVILSPTDVAPAGRGWPVIGDFIVVGGREMRIKAAPVVRMDGQVVRVDMTVEG